MPNISELSRFREVVSVLFDYEFHHIISKLSLKRYLPFHKRFENPELDSKTEPERLRLAFEKLGGAFIKLGQILALRPDLVGERYSKEFEKLLDSVEPENPELIRSMVRHIPFSKFDPKPIGSGSVAQVHEAMLNGKKVAVKIKRHNIDKIFENDIKIMLFFAKEIKKHYDPEFVDLEEIVKEFRTYTIKELDLRHEASNIRKFRHDFRNSKTIFIPRVHETYSDSSILVMDYVDGVNIRKIKKGNKVIIRKVTDNVYKMLFENRFFHADLHPGNIFVKGNKIMLLDFGITGHIDKSLERKLFHLFSALVNGNLERTADSLLEINISKGEPDERVLKEGIYNVLGDYYDLPLEKMDFGSIFFGAIEVARTAKIKIPAQLVLFGKSIVTLEGFCRELDPDFNIVKNAKPYIDNLIRKKLAPKRIIQQGKDVMLQLDEMLFTLPENMKSLMRKFTMIEERVIDIDNTLRTFTSVIWKSAKLISMSLLFMVFVVLGVVIFDIGPMYEGVPLLSSISFVVGLVFFLAIVRLFSE